METKHLETPGELTQVLGRELSPEAIDKNGWTDLHHAALFNLTESARALLAGGAKVNAALKRDGRQLDMGLKTLLFDLGVMFQSWEREGETPLHLAACSNARATANLLLDSGADLMAGLELGGTPLNVAARFNALETVALLLERGADLGAPDLYGLTPLHNAVGNGALQAVRLLLEAGADVNAKADRRVTPLHLAVMYKAPLIFDDPTVLGLLLDWGAEVNALMTALGATALDIAGVLGRPRMAECLRRHGGDATAHETTKVVGMVDVKLGRGGVLMPIMQRTVKRRRPRRPRLEGAKRS